MDISKITDLKELKAMAYDELASRQTAEANLVAINTQINRILDSRASTDATDDKPKTDKEADEQA